MRVTAERETKRQRSIDESSLYIESKAKRNKNETPGIGNQGARKEPATKQGRNKDSSKPKIRKEIRMKEKDATSNEEKKSEARKSFFYFRPSYMIYFETRNVFD